MFEAAAVAAGRLIGAVGQGLGGWRAPGLSAALAANSPATEKVDLSCNLLGEAAFVEIFRALAANRSCRWMFLDEAGVGDEAAAALAEALRQNAHLKVLRLWGNSIGDVGAQRLAGALETNSALTELDLEKNAIGDAGAEALAGALKTNSTLRVLDLSDNPIGDAGAGALAGALPMNHALEELRISYKPISDQVASQLRDSAARSKSLRRIRNTFWRPHHEDKTFTALSENNFLKAYKGAAPFPDEASLVQGIGLIVDGACAAKGMSGDWGNCLTQALRRKVQGRAGGDPRVGAGVAWTCAEEFGGIRFYSAVQGVLRGDEKGPVMAATARYCQTLNLFLCQPKARRAAGTAHGAGLATGIIWAFRNDAGRFVPFSQVDSVMIESAHANGDPELRTADLSFNAAFQSMYTFDFQEMTQLNHDSGKKRQLQRADASTIPGALPEAKQTTRGVWLPRRYAEWFEQDLVYRYAGFLASTDAAGVAEAFLEDGRPRSPEDARERDTPVKFRFHFDPFRGCDHVNLLDDFTDVPGEREWLFPPYSAFKVRTPADFTRPHSAARPAVPVIIELDVVPDNKEAPDDVPLAGWH